MADNPAPITLRLLTPEGLAAETLCDSAILTICDGADGRGGGLVGIRRDHAPAVFALGAGRLEASTEGKRVLAASVSGGFASVRDNVITVITDSLQ